MPQTSDGRSLTGPAHPIAKVLLGVIHSWVKMNVHVADVNCSYAVRPYRTMVCDFVTAHLGFSRQVLVLQ